MSGNESKPRPLVASEASMMWDIPPDPDDRYGMRAPFAAESVALRIKRERTRRGPARTVLRSVVPAVAAVVVALTIASVTRWDLAVLVGVVAGVGVRAVWTWLTDGPVVRQLRRQVRRERRVGRSLAPLESAGWTVLHERMVAAHRVPHVLVGPPGVVLVYDYLAGSRWRYRARRLGAFTHSATALALAVPFVALHRRGLPRLTASTAIKTVTPGATRTAAWARDRLADQLGKQPLLDEWKVNVYAFYVLLNRPADRVAHMGHGVGAEDLGHRMCTHMEDTLPAGLGAAATAHLARIVDEQCPPPSPDQSGGHHF